MPLEPPVLDDRRFDELVAEARARIPRYTPEWTDHNLSDPGITLIQLFAWLSELILFRLNRVPERNYIKFLELIGIERKQAVPAQAELTFTLASPDTPYVIVPKGTRVGAEAAAPPPSALAAPALAAASEEPLVFETDETLIAIGATLAAVQVFDGNNYIAVTEANATAGEHYLPFGRKVRTNSSLLLGFSSNNAFPAVEVNLAVRVYRDRSSTEPHDCPAPGVEEILSANLIWEYWNGTKWQKAEVLKDETRAMTESGHVYFRGPSDSRKSIVGAVVEELYWFRCRVVQSYYDTPPELDAVITNTVRAIAVATTTDEVIGASNGTTNQIFRLRTAPVYAAAMRSLDDRLRSASAQPLNETEQAAADAALRERELIKGFLLEVTEGDQMRPWEEVEDFFNSKPEDMHYVLNRATGEIQFGNGVRGRVPLAGIENVVVRYYRSGGGARGNVGADAIKDLQASITGLDSVTNLWAAEGGSDEEAIEDTKARAPREIKARDRAVTAQDFEFLAMQTPGVRVRRAHAMPLYHPDFPDTQVPGVITVMVVPETDDPNPTPSEATLKAVCAWLNGRRLLTSEVFVAPPKYTLVRVEATIIASGSANPATVKSSVEAALGEYLHPLTGGSDGQGWPLGGAVVYSEVFRVVLTVDGVQRIDQLRILVDGDRKDKCEDAVIPADHLVYSDGHDVTILTSV